jgi:holo-[acyl-carrier protein] synthase
VSDALALRAEATLALEALLGGAQPGVRGVGVDLIEVARIDRAVRHYGERFVRRVFTPREADYCAVRPRSSEHYAARWTAKEAASKALGTGLSGDIGWRDFEVITDARGGPEMHLHGGATRAAASAGVGCVILSLAHTGGYALAVALALGDVESA